MTDTPKAAPMRDDVTPLLPCPYCGDEMHLGYDSKTGYFGPEAEHQNGCMWKSVDLPDFADEHHAIATWNMRAHTARPDAGDELARGKAEIRTLIESIWRAEFRKDVPNWKPLDDLPGMISQMDNMYAGVRQQRDQACWDLHNRPDAGDAEVERVDRESLYRMIDGFADFLTFDADQRMKMRSRVRVYCAMSEAAAMREGERGMVDAATALFSEGTMYRSGHDGTGPDPSRFFCEAISDAPDCRRVRVVADTEAQARSQAAAALEQPR